MAQQKQRCPLAPNCPDGQEFHYAGTKVLADHAAAAAKGGAANGAGNASGFVPKPVSASFDRELTDEEVDEQVEVVFDTLRAHDINFPMQKISSGDYSYGMYFRGVDQSHNVKSFIEDSVRDGDPLTIDFSPTADNDLYRSVIDETVPSRAQEDFPDSGNWSSEGGIVTVEFNPEEHSFDDLVNAIDKLGEDADWGVLIDESDYSEAEFNAALDALEVDDRFNDIDTELLPDLAAFVSQYAELDQDGTYNLDYVDGLDQEADRLRGV